MRNICLLFTIIVAAVALGIEFRAIKATSVHVNKVEHPTYKVVSESGFVRAGLFDKQQGGSEVIAAPLRIESARRKCKDESSVLSRLLRFVSVTEVSAASCEETTCGGSYMSPSAIDCGYNCGGGKYLHYTQGTGGWLDGWKYDGFGVCPAIDNSGNCICKEASCTNY